MLYYLKIATTEPEKARKNIWNISHDPSNLYMFSVRVFHPNGRKSFRDLIQYQHTVVYLLLLLSVSTQSRLSYRFYLSCSKMESERSNKRCFVFYLEGRAIADDGFTFYLLQYTYHTVNMISVLFHSLLFFLFHFSIFFNPALICTYDKACVHGMGSYTN